MFVCDKCKRSFNLLAYGHDNTGKYHYCPYCGSKEYHWYEEEMAEIIATGDNIKDKQHDR